MNPHIPLYQFTRAMHQIMLARITQVRINSDSGQSREVLNIDVETIETLWGEHQPARRSYVYERPASWTVRAKFPDPVWGQVDVREGLQILIVSGTGSPTAPAGPIYVDQIENPDDPVLKSIKGILAAEGSPNAGADHFGRRLRWLTNGTNVEKLFAGEALAREGTNLSHQQGEQLVRSFSDVYARETDEYVKISLGTWLWDYIYERTDEAGRIQILNATIAATSVPSELVSGFALDHVLQADPRLLRNPGVHPTAEFHRLLDKRKEQETDPEERRRVDAIIHSIAR
jgi:hypothetical protein